MMLVRLDPASATINLLSIPRDLEVQLYSGGGAGRLNAANSIGGPNLLIRILSTQVFPGLQVNHIIDVNFGGFEALVNSVGCVYVDVDHRYYNNTAYTNYSSIDLKPGYQKLCGSRERGRDGGSGGMAARRLPGAWPLGGSRGRGRPAAPGGVAETAARKAWPRRRLRRHGRDGGSGGMAEKPTTIVGNSAMPRR